MLVRQSLKPLCMERQASITQISDREEDFLDNETLTQASNRKSTWTEENLQRLLADAITYKSPLEDIGVILKCGGDVNRPIKKGLRPLHYAAYVDYTECMEYMINEGADVNVTDDIGYTPLHLCARRGFAETMGVLIRHGAVLNYCGNTDEKVKESTRTLGYMTYEPLNMSIENNHVECVRLLLKNGAKTNTKYFMGYEISLVPPDNLLCLELLLQYGANPDVFNRCGLTPLMKACRENRKEVVKLLLKYGANVNIICPPKYDQRSALHHAIQSGNVNIVLILLKHGAFLQKPRDYKYSPLHTAVLSDKPDFCRLLLENGADVDEVTDDHSTPLMLACASNNLKERKAIVTILLQFHADVNAHSPYVSYTDPCLAPLTEYLKNSQEPEESFVRLLLLHGARVSICADMTVFKVKDPFGILYYVSKVSKELLEVLVEASCCIDVNATKLSELLPAPVKRAILEVGSAPRDLKHQCRLVLRDNLETNLPATVEQLPLPKILKSYLLFQ